MKRVIYLTHRRDVELLRFLQRMQRARGRSVVMKHSTLARRLGCSESSARRSVDRLVQSGHLLRTYLSRPRGGRLCVYWVHPDVIYRRASTPRRAKEKIEQLVTTCKRRSRGRLRRIPDPGGESLYPNRDNKRPARRSLLGERDKELLGGLMEVAKTVGIDDRQRGFLRSAALKYGVREAWRALQIAVDGGYMLSDLVKVTWGILRRQYPEGVGA